MLFKVHVQPFAVRVAGTLCGFLHESRGDALSPERRIDDRVEDERVASAIPSDVYPPHQLGDRARTSPAKAMFFDLRIPVPGEVRGPVKALGVQLLNFFASKGISPGVFDHRDIVGSRGAAW